MSRYDYEVSKEIAMKDYPFYALLFALIRQADTMNLERLKAVFPDQVKELTDRYNAPGGILPGEE